MGNVHVFGTIVLLIAICSMHPVHRRSNPKGVMPRGDSMDVCSTDCLQALRQSGRGTPERKRSRTEDVQTVSDADGEPECYFSQERISHKETVARNSQTSVSTSCGGQLHRLSQLMESAAEQMYGAQSEAELIYKRGTGDYQFDLDNPDTEQRARNIYVCKEHINELGHKWAEYDRRKHFLRNRPGRPLCGIPDDEASVHATASQRPKARKGKYMSVEFSEVYEEKYGRHVHPGQVLCKLHHEFMERLLAQKNVESAGRDIVPPTNNFANAPTLSRMSSRASSAYCSSQSQPLSGAGSQGYIPGQPHSASRQRNAEERAVSQFAAALGIGGLSERQLGKEWLSLAARSRRRKLNQIRRMFGAVLRAVAGRDAQTIHQVQQMVIRRKETEPLAGSSGGVRLLAREIGSLYERTNDKFERRALLSLIAPFVTYPFLQEYIADLTPWRFKDARKYKMIGRPEQTSQIRVRYDWRKVDAAISFITQPHVQTLLPFGELHTQTTTGSRVSLPMVVRGIKSEHLYRQYNRWADNHCPDLKLSRSTFLQLLDDLKGRQRKATHGFDYIKSDMIEGFETLEAIVKEIGANGRDDNGIVGPDWEKNTVHRIQQCYSYLTQDYSNHIKISSRIGTHCATHALSDSQNPRLALSCANDATTPHTHDIICSQCELVAEVKADIRSMAENVEIQEKDNLLAKLARAEKQIDEGHRHELRRVFAEKARESMVQNLGNTDALVTVDYMMKVQVPMAYRETSRDWYGKKTVSVHVSYIIRSAPNDAVKYIVYYHVIDDKEPQDADATVAIIEDVMKDIHLDGIMNIYLRSDNAGCYHSSSTISQLFTVASRTGVHINRVTFSEAQAGKAMCDVYSAVAKRYLWMYVDSGKTIDSAEDIVTALEKSLSDRHGTDSAETAGIRVHLVKIARPTNRNRKMSSIPNIRNYNTFAFVGDELIAWKYGPIGTGINVSPSLWRFENQPTATVQRQRTTIRYQWGIVTNTVQPREPQECAKAFSQDEVGTSPSTTMQCDDDRVFDCPQPNCVATFSKEGNLMLHMIRGKHNYIPQKITQQDYAIMTYKATLEGMRLDSAPTIVKEAFYSVLEGEEGGNSKGLSNVPQGWALPVRMPFQRFSENVKTWLVELYDNGARTNRKMDPKYAAKLMETVELNGRKRFLQSELLQWRQIASFWSRRRSALQRGPTDTGQVDLEDRPTTEGNPDKDFEDDPMFATLEDELVEHLQNTENELSATVTEPPRQPPNRPRFKVPTKKPHDELV